MGKFVLKRFDGTIQANLSWIKKTHAEAWIQHR